MKYYDLTRYDAYNDHILSFIYALSYCHELIEWFTPYRYNMHYYKNCYGIVVNVELPPVVLPIGEANVWYLYLALGRIRIRIMLRLPVVLPAANKVV